MLPGKTRLDSSACERELGDFRPGVEANTQEPTEPAIDVEIVIADDVVPRDETFVPNGKVGRPRQWKADLSAMRVAGQHPASGLVQQFNESVRVVGKHDAGHCSRNLGEGTIRIELPAPVVVQPHDTELCLTTAYQDRFISKQACPTLGYGGRDTIGQGLGSTSWAVGPPIVVAQDGQNPFSSLQPAQQLTGPRCMFGLAVVNDITREDHQVRPLAIDPIHPFLKERDGHMVPHMKVANLDDPEAHQLVSQIRDRHDAAGMLRPDWLDPDGVAQSAKGR